METINQGGETKRATITLSKKPNVKNVKLELKSPLHGRGWAVVRAGRRIETQGRQALMWVAAKMGEGESQVTDTD